MKKCKICQQTKPYEDFNKYAKSFDGHLNKCRACVKQYYIDLTNGIRLSPEERYELIRQAKIKGMENERQQTKELLKGIGYDVDSELSIHQQFLIKHNLAQ